MSNGANKPDPEWLAELLNKAGKGEETDDWRASLRRLTGASPPKQPTLEESAELGRHKAKAEAARKKLADAIAAAEPAPAPAPKSMEAAVGKLSKEEGAEFTDIITKAQEAAPTTTAPSLAWRTPEKKGFDITVGGLTHHFGDTIEGRYMANKPYVDDPAEVFEPPSADPDMLETGAGIAGALLEGKEKRTELSKDFGKALRTGLETLTGEARQANVGALRDEMVGQGLTTAENFNRVGRKMLKDVEDERKRAKIDFLRSPAGGTVAAPGLGKLEAMQGRAFGTSTALSGSVGRLGEAARPLGTVAGRMRKEARALERRGARGEAGKLRGAAALTGEPGISTPAYREKQRAEEERTAALRKRVEEARVLLMEEYERRNRARPDQPGSDIDPGFYGRRSGKVNPRSTAGAGRGTPH